jgi:hypothetical protein
MVGAAVGCGTRRSVISLAAPRAFNRYCWIDAITNVHSFAERRRRLGCNRAIVSAHYPYETPDVLGLRQPSNHIRNAFGARHFQPHITLLKKGFGLDRDLTKIGEAFRASISPIRLNRFIVTCRSKPNVTV